MIVDILYGDSPVWMSQQFSFEGARMLMYITPCVYAYRPSMATILSPFSIPSEHAGPPTKTLSTRQPDSMIPTVDCGAPSGRGGRLFCHNQKATIKTLVRHPVRWPINVIPDLDGQHICVQRVEDHPA